jgi:hypothetical protein
MARGARRAVLGFVPGSGLQFRTRTTVNSNDSVVTLSGISLPVWVRLERNATTSEITASYANDSSGTPGAWFQIGSPTIVTMDNRANVGLTTTSNSTSSTATATLDQVTLTPAPTGPALISEDASATPSVVGSASESSGTYTIAGGTAGYFHGWQFSGDVMITVRHASATSGAGSATSGIRISENIESGAFAHVGRIPTGSFSGYYWRSIAAGSTGGVPSFTGGTRWVRIVRRGNSVTAFHAADVSGSPGTWAQLGQPQTVIMTVPVFIGFWVDNVSGVGLNTVTFNNLSIVPLNKAPVVEAGTFLAATTSPVLLDGSVTDDNLPAPIHLATQWSQVSGPGPVSFASPSSVDTLATFQTLGMYRLRLAATDGSAQSFDDVTFTGGLPTELLVEQPEGVELPSGGTVTFGTVNPGGTADRQFTIRNTGPGDLSLTGTPHRVQLSGSGAAAFAILAQPPSTLSSSSGPATFTVRFAPLAGGPHTATLTIANNDSDEGNFAVTLAATANSIPVLTLPTSPVVAEATSSAGAAVTFPASATDVEDGALVPSLSLPSGSIFPIGDTIVTAAVNDSNGASAAGSFIVRVRDTTPPLISAPNPISIMATSPSGAVVSFSTSATDVVDGAVPAIATPPSGTNFPPGITTVVVAASDSRGNPAQRSFTVTVIAAPEFGIELSGSEIPQGSVQDFGTVNTGSETSRTFTIKNAGMGALSLISSPAVRLSGPGASHFSVTSQPVNSVPALNETTFTVKFAPVSAGLRSATLSISNNDPDEGSFFVTLSGRGNSVPSGISLSPQAITENLPANSTAGYLSATDPDPGATHTFRLVSGPGDADNGKFSISGTSLILQESADFETKSQYQVRLEADDGQQGVFAKAITVSVTNVPELTLAGSLPPQATDYGSASSPRFLTIDGDGLGVVTATAPPGFEVSFQEGSGYGPSATTTPPGGNLVGARVYVRLPASTPPGSYSGPISVSAGPSLTDSALVPASTVALKQLTLENAAVATKSYDGTTDATITGTLSGIIGTDLLDFTGTGNFASANAGTNIPVTPALTLTGPHASRYTLAQPSGLTGSILKATQTITFAPLPARPYGDAPFALTASASSGLPVTFTSLNPSVATVTDQTVTIVAAGTASIRATQPGTANIEAAPAVEQSFPVAPSQLVFQNAAVVTKPYDGTTTATITGSLSGLRPGDEVSFTGTGNFASANPGTSIPVTALIALTGAHANRYALVQPQGLNGTILGSTVSFGSDVYRPSQLDNTITLTLVRTGRGLARVTLRTNDGVASEVPPFSPAVAGTDYFDADGQVITFADGETTKPVPVTLFPRTSGTAPNRRFEAAITSVVGGRPGTISVAAVEILATDLTKPSLALNSPSSGALLKDTTPFITLSGTAGDNRGLDRVTVAHNNSSPIEADLGGTTNPASVPWTLQVEAADGANNVTVVAYDLTGNSTTLTRSFTFRRTYPLALSRTAPAAVPRDTAGSVTLTASPPANASSLAPTAPNADPRSAQVVSGTSITLTATARRGFTFAGWSGLPSGADETGSVVRFAMPASGVQVDALFRSADVFSGPPGSGNTFQGILLPIEGAPTSNANVAFLTGTLSSSGSFSGRLFVDGVTQPVNATFFGDGSAVFTTASGVSDDLVFGGRSLSLSYNAGEGNDAITASLRAGGSTSRGLALRALYSPTNPVPQGLLNHTPARGNVTQGSFTVALPAKPQVPARASSTYPQGDGYALLTLTQTGFLTGTGVLADGSAFSVASALVTGNHCPIFAQLSTPGQAATVRGGAFFGTLVFNDSLPDTDVTATGLRWIRPDVTGLRPGRGAAAAAAALYTSGWPAGIEVDALGAHYDKSVTLQSALDLDGPTPDGKGGTLAFEDGKLVIRGGKLPNPITKQNFIVSGNSVTKLPATDSTFALAPDVETGTFTGSFLPGWTNRSPVNPAFRGVLLQKGAHRGGHGFFLSNAMGDSSPESGDVDLTLEPSAGAFIPVASSVPSVVSASSPYTITGTAGNIRGVSRVEVRLNGASPATALLGPPNAAGAVPYSLTIEPALGTNTLTVTAYDARGNASTETFSFEFLRRYQLSLSRTVPAAVSPDAAGAILLNVTPSSQASALLPATANANPRRALVQHGSSVLLTAVPRPGYAFLSWSGLPAGASASGNTASFPMPINDSAITAEFVRAQTVFAGPPGSGNHFYGLIRPETGTATSNATAGFLTGTLASNTGIFTGELLIDGDTQTVNVTFHGNGDGVFNIGRLKQNSFTFDGRTVRLSLNTLNGSDEIAVTVTAAGRTSSGVAQRSIYSAAQPPPSALRNVSARTGFATVVFPVTSQTPALDPASYPQGDGFSTVTISDTGAITMIGTLADNSVFTASSGLVKGDQCPFFAQILTPGSRSLRGGSFSGTLKFDLTRSDSDLTGTSLLWIRPPVTEIRGTSATALATQLYTNGWPNGIRLTALGGLYDRRQTVQTMLGLGPVNVATGNSKLDFADGKLTGPITKTNFNISGNAVAKIPAADPTFNLTLTAPNGTFNGSFRPNWVSSSNALVSYRGVLIQKGSNRGGFGFFLSNIPSDLDPQSGGVTLGNP